MVISLSTTTMLTGSACPRSIEPARASIGHYKLFAQDAVGKSIGTPSSVGVSSA